MPFYSAPSCLTRFVNIIFVKNFPCNTTWKGNSNNHLFSNVMHFKTSRDIFNERYTYHFYISRPSVKDVSGAGGLVEGGRSTCPLRTSTALAPTAP